MASKTGFPPEYPKTERYGKFLGLESPPYSKARTVLLPVPYSSTTYWKSGTKDGPQVLIDASRRLEHYDQELKCEPLDAGIYTLNELEASKNSPKETLQLIEGVVGRILRQKKFPLMLGGEHSITYGSVSACGKVFKDLCVLQLDAHPDLSDKSEGTKYHHGCVMRRIIEDLKIPVVQVGARSVSSEEIDYIKKTKKSTVFFAPEIPINEILKNLAKNVYLSVDLDFFDPAHMPATGTPEPGGYSWYDGMAIMRKVFLEKNVVAADVVELCPIPGLHAADFFAAKLVYKLIGYKYAKETHLGQRDRKF